MTKTLLGMRGYQLPFTVNILVFAVLLYPRIDGENCRGFCPTMGMGAC